MKKTCTLLILLISSLSFAQAKEPGTDWDIVKQNMMYKDPNPAALSQNNDIESVKSVLFQYNKAVEKLDVTGTEKLFTPNAKIYESGGSEGNYPHYLEQHLIPELKEFKSFKFSDYKAEVQVEGKYAFATESYSYQIVLAKDNTEIKCFGVATSVLKKIKGEWKIMISHNSSRK